MVLSVYLFNITYNILTFTLDLLVIVYTDSR